MVVRASFIFLVSFILNFLSAFLLFSVFHSENFLKLNLMDIVRQEAYLSFYDQNMRLITLTIIISSAIFGILGAVSWRLMGRIHPCFGVLANILGPIIFYIIFYDREIISWTTEDKHFLKIDELNFITVLVGALEANVICCTWWLAKQFFDTKGSEIGISLTNTDKRFKYSFFICAGILCVESILLLPIRQLLILPSSFPDFDFLIMLYDFLTLITVVFSIVYAFYRLQYTYVLKMKNYTRSVIAIVFIFNVIMMIFAFINYFAANLMAEDFMRDVRNLVPILGFMFLFVWNLCHLSLIPSLAFWVTRCFAGKFKTDGEANICA